MWQVRRHTLHFLAFDHCSLEKNNKVRFRCWTFYRSTAGTAQLHFTFATHQANGKWPSLDVGSKGLPASSVHAQGTYNMLLTRPMWHFGSSTVYQKPKAGWLAASFFIFNFDQCNANAAGDNQWQHSESEGKQSSSLNLSLSLMQSWCTWQSVDVI